MLTLPWSQPGCPPLCVALPKGEDWVSPRANKPACRPVLTNTGRRGATGTATNDEKEKEDVEKVIPWRRGGQLRATEYLCT